MQFTRRSRKRAMINITSMIDILFLLIIFFVVTSSFLEPTGMTLELPAAESAQATESVEMVLSLDAEGTMRLGDRVIDIGSLGEALNAAMSAEDAGRVLVIRADQASPHGQVVQIMDIAKRVGVSDLVIATEVEAPGPPR